MNTQILERLQHLSDANMRFFVQNKKNTVLYFDETEFDEQNDFLASKYAVSTKHNNYPLIFQVNWSYKISIQLLLNRLCLSSQPICSILELLNSTLYRFSQITLNKQNNLDIQTICNLYRVNIVLLTENTFELFVSNNCFSVYAPLFLCFKRENMYHYLFEPFENDRKLFFHNSQINYSLLRILINNEIASKDQKKKRGL